MEHRKPIFGTIRPHADHSAVDIGSSRDTIGNSRTTDKWENLISSDCDYYPECDRSTQWTEITDALADTPNNKAPGADGVPSEQK
ncbi:hypothetical protein AYI69_g9719 [Smittium culicis]|uniref:Uncharacterized protein n=1 Tax=Smittium culicis TaxID=133412 RepID=A0A1R1XAV9_9FUNG|nr:hypothetical protein AYI69_g9719 [Smittium culicis]